MIYKTISTTGNLDDLIAATANALNITISEASEIVIPYIQGQIDKADLLADIAGQLDTIPGRIDDLDLAKTVIENQTIPTPLKTVLIGICDNQQNQYRIIMRELKAWRFVINNAKFE